MHSPTLANDFSFRLTLAFAPFSQFFLAAFDASPANPLFSHSCGLFFSLGALFDGRLVCFQYLADSFCKTPGVRGTSATSPRLPVLRAGLCVITCLFLPSLYFHPLTNPLSTRIDSQHSLFSRTYKSLFPQLLCIHIYTKRPGVTPPHNFSADPTRIGIPTERSDEGRFPHVIPRLRPAKPRGIRHFPQPVLSSSHPRGIC